MASSSDDGTIRMWSISSLNEAKGTEDQGPNVDWVEFSPDGTLLASASANEGLIRLWTTKTGVLTIKITDVVLNDTSSFIFSPDGKQLASISRRFSANGVPPLNDYYIQFNDPNSGSQLIALKGNLQGVHTTAFSSDSKQLAVSLEPGPKCWVWKTTSALIQQEFTFPPSYSLMLAIAFFPDNQRLAVSFYSGQIDIWDLVSSSRLHTLKSPTEQSPCVAFSPDGMQLLSGSFWDPKAIRLWDVIVGNLSATIEAGKNVYGTSSLAFSASGDRFAVSFHNCLTHVWKFAAGSISWQESFDVGSAVEKLSFCDREPYLETERGLIRISSDLRSSPATMRSTRRNALFLKGNWITRDMENLLWLPTGYRATCVSYRNDVLAICHASGMISFFEFQFDD